LSKEANSERKAAIRSSSVFCRKSNHTNQDFFSILILTQLSVALLLIFHLALLSSPSRISSFEGLTGQAALAERHSTA
jgi:hypothetical protein